MRLFLQTVAFLPQKTILIADAYYASKKVIKPLLRQRKNTDNRNVPVTTDDTSQNELIKPKLSRRLALT